MSSTITTSILLLSLFVVVVLVGLVVVGLVFDRSNLSQSDFKSATSAWIVVSFILVLRKPMVMLPITARPVKSLEWYGNTVQLKADPIFSEFL